VGSHVRVDKRKLEQLIRQNPRMADDALNATALAILADIQLSFNTSPAGRSYTRGGVTHVASMPGQPPNIDTGALRASMRVERRGRLHYELMDGVTYGVLLELGTSRMAARPFMTPAIETWRAGEFARFMAAEWLKGL
jgi:hypothetical protein